MDLDALPPLARLLVQVGIFVVAAAGLWYAVLQARKDRQGNPRSALLVPGWEHDRQIAETERVRAAYEARLADVQRDQDARQAEWRRLRDEERARAAEADLRLSASTAVLRELVTVVGEARVEVARLAGVAVGAARAGGGDGDA
jgi:hypothetical protein